MKFTKDEIKNYNQQLSHIFKEYCAEHKFGVHSLTSEWSSMHKVYLGPNNTQYPASFKIEFLDSNEYFKEHKFFNDDLKVISPVKISDRQQFIQPHQFWQYADDRLDKKGQVLFQRIITNTFQAHAFQTLIEKRSSEQKWFYIKHIHDGERKAGTQGEFMLFFDFVKTQKLDNEEKIQNFYILCKHSRNIIKKPEYTPVVCDFIHSNIPQSHHENFELLLGRKLKRDLMISDSSDIMTVTASQTMTLQKDKCYEKFNFLGESIPNINNLNSLNHSIIRALKHNFMEKLNLSDILIVPFVSEHNHSKITFEFSTSEHRNDMPNIYIALVEQCAPIYDKTCNYENIEKNVIATLNHYFLDQQLNKEQTKSSRVKI